MGNSFGPALCCGCHYLGGGDIDKSLLMEVLVNGMRYGAAYLENRSDPWSPGVQETGVKPCIEIGRDLLHNIERKRAVGQTDNLE